MQLSPSKRNLGRAAGILGLLQGLSWAGLSLAAIIMHNWSPTLQIENPTYTRLIGLLLYARFIHDNNLPTSFVVRPFDFTIFMWIYFILSVGWAALSIDQLTAIHFNKGRQKIMIFVWGVVTLITCLIDLIFTCLLARDYANCDEGITDISEAYYCYLATGIAMTIAARGFALWMVNLVLSFSMLYVSTKIQKKDKLANLFSNHSIPRVIIPRPTSGNVQQRGGDQFSANFPESESPIPSFLYQDKYTTDDTLTSDRSRRSKSNDSNVPSFLSRGEKFSY